MCSLYEHYYKTCEPTPLQNHPGYIKDPLSCTTSQQLTMNILMMKMEAFSFWIGNSSAGPKFSKMCSTFVTCWPTFSRVWCITPGVAKPLLRGKKMPPNTFSCALWTMFFNYILKSATFDIKVLSYRNLNCIWYALKQFYRFIMCLMLKRLYGIIF